MHSRRLIVAVAALAAAVVALAVGVSTGAGSDRPVGKTKVRSAGAKMSLQRRRGAKVAYLAAAGTAAPGQNIGHAGRCPRRTPHPVSGFLSSDALRLVLTDSAPLRANARTNRDWGVAVVNLSQDQPANYTVGIVCIRLQ